MEAQKQYRLPRGATKPTPPATIIQRSLQALESPPPNSTSIIHRWLVYYVHYELVFVRLLGYPLLAPGLLTPCTLSVPLRQTITGLPGINRNLFRWGIAPLSPKHDTYGVFWFDKWCDQWRYQLLGSHSNFWFGEWNRLVGHHLIRHKHMASLILSPFQIIRRFDFSRYDFNYVSRHYVYLSA
jgi:hypothetical protein